MSTYVMEQLNLDIITILSVLDTHQVEFVVVGGVAAVAHGCPYSTMDLDIIPKVTVSNLRKLSASLQEIHATPQDGATLAVLTPKYVATHPKITYESPVGFIDILTCPNIGVYEDFIDNAVDHVVSLPDLIRLKETTNTIDDSFLLLELYKLLYEARLK